MRVIRNRPEWNREAYLPGRSVVAVGNFDGLHLGHQALIRRSQETAKTGEAVAVVTFEPLPLAFFRPEQAPARLCTVYQKLKWLESADVDICWLMRFDASLASLSARDFVARALVGKLNASRVVVGEDFRFGRRQEGDLGTLTALGEELGFEVEAVPAVLFDGERISSSRIRKTLAEGNFATAADCSGRRFRMEGHVIRGAGLGRTLGFPTANLAIRAKPSPVSGVLAAFARIAGGPWLPAVTNLGSRPVVNGKVPLLEVHIFDFEQDLYGQRLEVEFVAKLREELNFGSLDDLVAQMKRDERAARQCLVDSGPPLDETVDVD